MDDAVQPGTAQAAAPIFVLGSMRSGSTMLRLILDSHPHIAIGAETGFMGAVAAAKSIPGWRNGKDWYRRLDWTEDELDARLRDFYGGLFTRYAAGQGKRRWGEKTPFHTAHVAEMARVFPDAVFVAIVRHPGAVAASLQAKFHYTFDAAVSYWAATNLELVREGAKLGGRFVALRYEDLVVDGEPVIREMVSWLGEPWSPGLLEHDRVQRERGTPRATDGSTSTRDPIDYKRASNWARALRPEHEQTLRGVADLAQFFGYEPVDALARQPLPCGGGRRWLPDGADMQARMLQWPRLDFEQRPPTVTIDADPVELATRLHRVEQTLARVRSRKAVRLSDAIRTVQHGRSARDVRAAYALLRGRR